MNEDTETRPTIAAYEFLVRRENSLNPVEVITAASRQIEAERVVELGRRRAGRLANSGEAFNHTELDYEYRAEPDGGAVHLAVWGTNRALVAEAASALAGHLAVPDLEFAVEEVDLI